MAKKSISSKSSSLPTTDLNFELNSPHFKRTSTSRWKFPLKNLATKLAAQAASLRSQKGCPSELVHRSESCGASARASARSIAPARPHAVQNCATQRRCWRCRRARLSEFRNGKARNENPGNVSGQREARAGVRSLPGAASAVERPAVQRHSQLRENPRLRTGLKEL